MRSVLITGSNRGLGFGLVKLLVQQPKPPECIIASCRKPSQAVDLQQLAEKEKIIHILPLDVAKFDSYQEFVIRASSILNGSLNVLINNAGVPGKYGRISFLKPEHMIESYIVNTVAPTMLIKAFLPLLKKSAEINSELPVGSSRAAVINISSVLGSITDNTSGGFYTYRSSKCALNCMTKSLSIDLKLANILVTSLHPGWVKTDMGGQKAPLSVDEACSGIVSLMYNLSENHNGGFFNYDGSSLPW